MFMPAAFNVKRFRSGSAQVGQGLGNISFCEVEPANTCSKVPLLIAGSRFRLDEESQIKPAATLRTRSHSRCVRPAPVR